MQNKSNNSYSMETVTMQVIQKIIYPFSVLGKTVLDVIFPDTCGHCNNRIEDGEELFCTNCKDSIPRNYLNTVASIKQKLHRKKYYTYIAWSFGYTDIMRSLIHDFKFNSFPMLDNFLAGAMKETLMSRDDLKFADFLVPVPLHRSRYRLRGYNQSHLIAKIISDKTGIPVFNGLKRIRNTSPQSLIKDDKEKVKNVKGAFSIKDDGGLSGKDVILIDDIVTSGSTVNECAKVLKQAGAENVYILAAVVSKNN